MFHLICSFFNITPTWSDWEPIKPNSRKLVKEPVAKSHGCVLRFWSYKFTKVAIKLNNIRRSSMSIVICSFLRTDIRCFTVKSYSEGSPMIRNSTTTTPGAVRFQPEKTATFKSGPNVEVVWPSREPPYRSGRLIVTFLECPW